MHLHTRRCRRWRRFALPLLGFALLAGAVGDSRAEAVTFDLEPLGATWGGPFGDLPGDIVMTEDGIPMSVEEFHLGAFTGFNLCRIESAVAAFGSGQILRLNNIAMRFDFAAVPCAPATVTFEFADQGGDENLQVNGGPLFEVADLTVLDGVMVAPGVLCEVSAGMVGGFLVGTVRLSGPVDKFLTGGQEYYIENVIMDCGDACDFLVTHDVIAPGSCWGGALGEVPGDLAFTEDGIPVTLDEFDWGGGTAFNQACIVPTFCGMGSLRAINLNNIDAVYQIHALGLPVSEVTFEFIDLGGIENLQVNGGPLYIGEIWAAPAMIAPGVVCSVVTFPCGGDLRGIVTLTGNVQRLRTGGQEYWVDNVCVDVVTTAAEEAPLATGGLEFAPAWPNPFNPKTTLRFSLAAAGHARLSIHDVLGRELVVLLDGERPAGSQAVEWDGRDAGGRALSSGVYFARLLAAGEERSQKLVLSK